MVYALVINYLNNKLNCQLVCSNWYRLIKPIIFNKINLKYVNNKKLIIIKYGIYINELKINLNKNNISNILIIKISLFKIDFLF